MGPAVEGIDTEVLIVGAGISGIGAGIALRQHGHDSFLLLERGEALGGTWRDNTYPGVAVDIPSSSYSFSFETDFPWSHALAKGAQILAYIQHCSHKHGIDEHIRYGAEVRSARFDAATNIWETQLTDGRTFTSRYLVAATGLFGAPIRPDLAGLDAFRGQVFHTSRWDHADLAGKRVAVVGTGPSGVQVVGAIARDVGRLSVFQRTPIWVAPRFDYALPAPSSLVAVRRFAAVRRLVRWGSEAQLELLTLFTAVYGRMPFLLRSVNWVVRQWMRRQILDPDTREKLIPAYTLGCKRPATSNTYLSAFNLDHVELITAPIERVEPEGVVTAEGRLHPIDVLVLATGFLTTERENNPAFEVVGEGGQVLGQLWDQGRLQAYQGVAVPGFPNFFLTAGPYSGGFNWFSALEAHLGLVMRCLVEAADRGATRVEVRPEAHEAYMRDMWRYADGTIFKDVSCAKAHSYYLDRHGDASLPLPRTPWWRVWTFRRSGTTGFRFNG